MSSHDTNPVSYSGSTDRNVTTAIEAGEHTRLETPIKVKWRGAARAKIEGHCLDADTPSAELVVEATSRLKTRLVCRTAEEAAAVLSQLSRYGPGRVWLNPNQSRTLRRVETEVTDALEERQFDVVQSDRGLYTVFEVPVAMADGGSTLEPDYTCRRCDWAGDDCDRRDHYPVCPNCSRIVTVNRELVADGGVPDSFEDLASTCESCGDDVDPDRLIEGICPGCQYRPDAMADGGEVDSEESGDTVVQREPEVDDLNNGAVRIVIDVSDPVTDLGIRTDNVSVEADGKVSEELAEHLWDELFLDVDDFGIGVFD
ncbi:hypothetical protein [Halolamina sp.]|uniref:hypothetical protein n=1 Tax=Halolamina sp. TaxID=1940283 RepID=UPI00356557BF